MRIRIGRKRIRRLRTIATKRDKKVRIRIKPPIEWVPGALSLGVKRPGREADHSPPSSDEAKNEWSYASTPQYAFIA
jgi:hypothetical protein